ncbi:hypothetical protein HN680_00940, partial [Candidatus Peregrinibacteria bacterium]|nr:hypothetical protein [Candidatus Peregrinibacteria bacterium]
MDPAPRLAVDKFLDQKQFKIGLLEKVFREFNVQRFLDWKNRPILSDVDDRPSIARGADLIKIFDPLVTEVFSAKGGLTRDQRKHDLCDEYQGEVARRLREFLAASTIDSKESRVTLNREVTTMIKQPASRRSRRKGAQKFRDKGKRVRALRDFMLVSKDRFCQALDRSFVFPEKRVDLSPAELEVESTILDPRVMGGFVHIWLANLEASDEEVAALMQEHFPEAGPWSPQDVALDSELKEALQEFAAEEGGLEMAQELFVDEINSEMITAFDLVGLDSFFEKLEDYPLIYEGIYNELADVGARRQAVRVRALIDCLGDLFTGDLQEGIEATADLL